MHVRTILPFIDDLTGSRDIAAIVATGFSVVCEMQRSKKKIARDRGLRGR